MREGGREGWCVSSAARRTLTTAPPTPRSERRGVSALAAQHADICAAIPMKGFSQSFNISVAVALFLAQLRLAGKMEGDLGPSELKELYTRWLILSNKSPKAVLERRGLLGEVPFL